METAGMFRHQGLCTWALRHRNTWNEFPWYTHAESASLLVHWKKALSTTSNALHPCTLSQTDTHRHLNLITELFL